MPEHIISVGSQTTNYIQYFIQDNKILILIYVILAATPLEAPKGTWEGEGRV